MPTCRVCATQNPDGFRFCGGCGTALAVAVCGSCGVAAEDGQRFCGQCGGAIVAPSSPVRAGAVEERKLATVLFADVVGFTSLAEQTDPEVVARLVDTAFRRLSDIVVDHGGTVDKYMGDSIMAVFGVPTAHDDDAERAVAAGLAMQQLGGDLTFSIGVNSGEVMVTALGRPGDDTVIGDAVNVAARLEEVAAPGQVLCGRLTTELAGGRVAFRECRPVLVKGKREPVEVFEATSLAGGPEGVGDDPPLVGRRDELAFLEAQWRAVRRDGQPRLVLLCGDAGSGKTRLLHELEVVARGEGTVLRTAHPAYGPMGGARVAADMIRQLGPVDDPEVNVRLQSLAGDVDPSLRSIDPSAMRQEQLWAFRRLLRLRGSEGPILVLIDDMHRSGAELLEMVADLAGRSTDVAVLTVLCGRSELGEWLSAFPGATTLRIGPLGRADAAALADALLGDRPLAPESAAVLAERAGGSPLYLRELIAVARAQGTLVDDGARFHLTDHAAIPASLQALLAARLDALEADAKLVFQHAALLGDAVTADQLSAMGVSELAPPLRQLLDGGLLRPVGDDRYLTADPLLSEVAYETLPRTLRGALHRRAAEVVARPEERARHLDRAADYLGDDPTLDAEAAEALARAGQDLLDRTRHRDALALLHRAVSRGWRRSDALLDLARLQALTGDVGGVDVTLALVDDDPEDPSVAVERDHIAANTNVFPNPGWALPRLEAVARRWRELGVPAKEAWATANAGVAYFNLSRMDEAAASLERALTLFDGLDDRFGRVAASSFLCLVKPTDPRVPDWLAESLAFADEAGDRSRQITSLSTLAWHHFFRAICGAPAAVVTAQQFARRFAELAEEFGTSELASQGWCLLTVATRLSGQIDAARATATDLDRVVVAGGPEEPWLARATRFMVSAATGDRDLVAPRPPETSTDPVVAMAGLVVHVELVLAGRAEEALSRFPGGGRPVLGPISDLTGVSHALALVLAGRGADALELIDRVAAAAATLGSPAVGTAAAALRAEVTGDPTGLPDPPAPAQGVADVLVLRAHVAVTGRSTPADLRRAAHRLGAPGLVLHEAAVSPGP